MQRELLARSTVRIDTSLSYCHYSLNDSTLASSGFLDLCREKKVRISPAPPLHLPCTSPASTSPAPPLSPNRVSAASQVALINASPISMGLLMERPPPDWHPASAATKALCARAVEYCKAAGVRDGGHLT